MVGPCPAPANRPRRGMAYIEVVAASIVFGLTLGGLGATIGAQEKLMRALEDRTYVLMLVPCDRRIRLEPTGGDPPLRQEPYPRTDLQDVEIRAIDLLALPGADPVASAVLGPMPSLLTVHEARADDWPEVLPSMETPRLAVSRLDAAPGHLPLDRPIAITSASATTVDVAVGP